MTIAAGFKCHDGILLASDTLYSGSTNYSFGPKLWVLQALEPVVVFGGSGTVGPMTRARDEIERQLKPGLSFQSTLEIIDASLLRVHKKFPPAHGLPPHVQALAVIRAEGRNRLYQNIANETALNPVDGPHVCLGVDTLGNYFADALFSDGIALEWAEIVAAYLVANCKEYARGYCGGDTHLAIIPDDPKQLPFMKTNQDYMRELEEYLQGIGRGLHAVLPHTSPRGSPSTETLKKRAEFINDAIGRAEKDIYEMPDDQAPST